MIRNLRQGKHLTPILDKHIQIGIKLVARGKIKEKEKRDYSNMHSKGHFGLALGVMSLLMIPFGLGANNLVFLTVLLSAMLSALPDLDIKWGIPHRKITHNILFALIIGFIFGVMFGYASGIWYFFVGFIGGFMGIMIHLLGDVMTYMKFKPFYPFSHKEYAWGLFPAKSKRSNDGFFAFGIVCFFGYILISVGALSSMLP